MPFWFYLLSCADGSYYVGHTDDLERRLVEHQSGAFGGYTSTRLPVALAFAEEFPTRDEAICRERQVKNWSRAKKAALAARNWNQLSRLARGRDRPE